MLLYQERGRKVLITGANGFIGRALCDKLLADGYQVRGAVRGAAQMTALPSGVEGVMVGDIGPETDWSEALKGIDGVVHLAARVHIMLESFADPLAEYRKVNVEGTKCLAIAAANAGVKRFVYISSVKVNGEGTDIRGRRSEVRGQEKTEVGRKRDERPTSNTRRARARSRQVERPTSNEKDEELATDPHRLTPVRSSGPTGQAQTFVRATCSGKNSHRFAKEKAEGRSDPYTEMDKPEPRDAYAVSKWEAEQGLMAIAEETGLEVVIIRPPLVYGPGVKANFRSLMKWVQRGVPLPLGAVYNKRSFVALDNLVSFIIHCIDHPKAANEVFLISDGEDVSTTELLQKMARAFGKRSFLLPVPVGLMTFVAGLLGKRDVADRLFGSLQVDSSKARDLLGWKPLVSMDEGLVASRKGAKTRR